MPLRVELYNATHVEAVRSFNERLAAGGVDPGYRLPLEPGPEIPPPVSKNTYLLLDGGSVRGAYMLQEQCFRAGHEVARVGNIQLPLSEGLIDRRYSSIGAFLLKHVQRENSLLFAVGMGSADQPWPRLIQAMGWTVRPVPFFFRVNRGGAFLRNIRPLRTSAARRAAMDVAAASGLATAGMKLLHAARSGGTRRPLEWRQIEEWGSWADDIWRTNEPRLSFAGVRNREHLAALYPPGPRHLCFALREGNAPVGWATLLSTKMSDHKQFGNMRVGTILDCMTLPGLERRGIESCVRILADADLVVANHTHRVWRDAFSAAGFLSGPSNFLLGLSKEAAGRTAGAEDDVYITRGDGDGRLNL